MTSKKVKQIAAVADSREGEEALAVFALCEDGAIHWTWADLNTWQKLSPISEESPSFSEELPGVGAIKYGWCVIGVTSYQGKSRIHVTKNGEKSVFSLQEWQRITDPEWPD